MKIITHYWAKPIPTRSHDWAAMYDNYEGGDPIGYGATEAAAIADLKEIADEPEVDEDCICGWSSVNSTTIDPPHQVRDQHCPVHGNLAARDPDAAHDEMRDRKMEDR